MKTITTILSILSLLVVMLIAGCTPEDTWVRPAGNTGQGGDVGVRFSFYTSAVKTVVSKADPDGDLMNEIDDVHLLIFNGAGVKEDGILPDTATVVLRNYLQYNVEQRVYLKSKQTYYIFAAANLNAANIPGGNLATYFDDVVTYADLKNKFVVMGASLIPEKLLMTTDSVIPVTLPSNIADADMHIPLSRVLSRIELNIYNKLDNDKKVASNVYPVSFTGLHIPMRSYLLGRNGAEKQDYADSAKDDQERDSLFTQTLTYALPAPTDTLIGNTWYHHYKIVGYTFENRQGTVNVGDVPSEWGFTQDSLNNVKNRKKIAPPYATIAQLTSIAQVTKAESSVMLTYVLPGKGREQKETTPDDKQANFDIDRNCKYYLNIYINGVNDVKEDSRREYLDQLVVLTLPDMRRVDAHYMDIPAFLTGKNGYAKFESYTCEVDGNGNIVYKEDDKTTPNDLNKMPDDGWLRFSWYSPYRAGQAKTVHYAGFRTDADSKIDGVSGATPILHFDEYIANPVSTEAITRPPRRTAVIRIGFVSEAMSATDYEIRIKDENVFYVPVSQWGLRTVGQVGGYVTGSHSYTTLLGVESVEEFRFDYNPKLTHSHAGVPWGFNGETKNTALNPLSAYDGKANTKRLYDDYRPYVLANKETYDPVYNTVAADYCMRKNRDLDGNGIIDEDEIKWYLPTPAQLMQISLWSGSFNYSFNIDYTPFLVPYWSSVESDGANAMGVNFSYSGVQTATVAAYAKTSQRPIRCVRDIVGNSGGMIEIENGKLIMTFKDHLPASILENKIGQEDKWIANLANNVKVQPKMEISRQYVRGNGSGGGNMNTIYTGGANDAACTNYAEDDKTTNWRLPTQREMSILYAYSGMIDAKFAELYAPSKYDPFQLDGFHWTITDDGDRAHFWGINFLTGASEVYQKQHAKDGYFRCVRYMTP